jgi:hypothetical protein
MKNAPTAPAIATITAALTAAVMVTDANPARMEFDLIRQALRDVMSRSYHNSVPITDER